MSTYCIYLTIYLGDKLPPFYIGSTSIDKINKGYHGSVTSAKFKNIWQSELKYNRHLFHTFIIPTEPVESIIHKLELEAKWQLAFDVVASDMFINQRIADRLLFSNSPESIAKGKAKRAKTFVEKNVGSTISTIQKGRRLWNNGHIQTFSHTCPGKGWVLGATEECKKNNSAAQLKRPPCSQATREKHRELSTGRTVKQETKERIRDIRTGTKRGPETCAKLSKSKKGTIPWNKGKQTGITSANANSVVLISPAGERFSYPSMRKACLAHELCQASMCSVRKGRTDNYKGWRVEQIYGEHENP